MLGLEHCTALEELYLSHNGILKLEGLSTLTKLKVGACSVALIFGTGGGGSIRLGPGLLLQEFPLKRHPLKLHFPPEIPPQPTPTSLTPTPNQSNPFKPKTKTQHPTQNQQVLDVSNNRLTAVESLTPLTALEDLWLNDNQIPALDGLDAALTGQRAALTTVYLHGNPAASDPRYKEVILALLPKLAQLDDRVLPARV